MDMGSDQHGPESRWRSRHHACAGGGGATIVNGTDAPVEDVNPILCFHAAVTRRMADGRIFFGDQKMTRREALASYTVNAARAAFEEDSKGTLAPGKLADLVVLGGSADTGARDLVRALAFGWVDVAVGPRLTMEYLANQAGFPVDTDLLHLGQRDDPHELLT